MAGTNPYLNSPISQVLTPKLQNPTQPQGTPLLGGDPQQGGGFNTSGAIGVGASLASGLISASTPETSVGGGIATGALSGAAAGSFLGPIGAGVGAVVGGITGAITSGTKKKAEEAAEEERKRLQNRKLISQDMQRFNETNALYANGGNLNITEYNGLGHNQGGLPLGQTGNEVEDGETRGIKSTKDYIFSDRLKPKGSKKTFADMSKAIEKKYKGLDTDKLAIEAKDNALNRLRNDQDTFKREKFQRESEALRDSDPEAFAKLTGGTQGATHTMPDGTVHPGATHEDYLAGNFANGGFLNRLFNPQTQDISQRYGVENTNILNPNNPAAGYIGFEEQNGIRTPVRSGITFQEYSDQISNVGSEFAQGGNLNYQTGGDVLPTGEPIIPPIERKYTYSSNASNRAPFLREWLQDPITSQRQIEQIGGDYTQQSINTIENTALVDLQKLRGKSAMNIQDIAGKINVKQGLTDRAGKGLNTVKNLQYMQQQIAPDYTQGATPDQDKGTLGISMQNQGSDIIGTQYPVMNPDVTGTATHELTHATDIDTKLGNYALKNWETGLLSDEDRQSNELTKNTDPTRTEYYKRPGEIYARIMQFRKLQGLKPGQKVTQEMLDAESARGVSSPLFGLKHVFKDEATIKDILEKIALNDPIQGLPQGGQQDFTNIVAQGGQLKKQYHTGGELGHTHPHQLNIPNYVQPLGLNAARPASTIDADLSGISNAAQPNIPGNIQAEQDDGATRPFRGSVGLAGLTALPNIATGIGSALLARNLDYDRSQAFGYSPDYVDPTRAIQEVRDQYAGVKDQIRQVSRGSGNYLSNLIGTTAGEAKAQAGVQSQFANINAGITNQAGQFNAQQAQRANAINTQIANREIQDRIGLRQNALSNIAAGANVGLSTYLQSRKSAEELNLAGGENFSYRRVKGAGPRPVQVFDGAGYRYYTDPKTRKQVFLDPTTDKKLTVKEKNALVKKNKDELANKNTKKTTTKSKSNKS